MAYETCRQLLSTFYMWWNWGPRGDFSRLRGTDELAHENMGHTAVPRSMLIFRFLSLSSYSLPSHPSSQTYYQTLPEDMARDPTSPGRSYTIIYNVWHKTMQKEDQMKITLKGMRKTVLVPMSQPPLVSCVISGESLNLSHHCFPPL